MRDEIPDQVFTLTFWFEPKLLNKGFWRGRVRQSSSGLAFKHVDDPEEAFELVRGALLAASNHQPQGACLPSAAQHRLACNFLRKQIRLLVRNLAKWKHR